MLNASQIALIRNSFTEVAKISDIAAERFYIRLFDLDPALRPLFKGDMADQGKKLMEMLAIAVAHLDKGDVLVPALQNLGQRHVAYGVEDAHYATVGRALLETLAVALGDAFTPEVQDAWTAAYSLVAETMIEASKQARTVTV
jgi:hemoglobin-like flavoprotein